MKPHKTVKCDSCKKEIVRAITQYHKKVSVFATPTENGNVYLVHRGDEELPLAMHAKFSRPDGDGPPKYRVHRH